MDRRAPSAPRPVVETTGYNDGKPAFAGWWAAPTRFAQRQTRAESMTRDEICTGEAGFAQLIARRADLTLQSAKADLVPL
jgi:hypothetical protein